MQYSGTCDFGVTITPAGDNTFVAVWNSDQDGDLYLYENVYIRGDDVLIMTVAKSVAKFGKKLN